MSHPFQGGVGERDELSFPRRGWGDLDESPKGGVSQGSREDPPIKAKGRGWGQIMLMCTRSAHLTTILHASTVL